MSALPLRVRGPSRPCPTSGRSPGPSLAIVNRDGTVDRSRSDRDQSAHTTRVAALLGTRIKSITHPSFDDPGARDAILGPMPAPAHGQAPHRTSVPKGVPTYVAALYEVPLLSGEQETHLFRKMNYLKFLAEQARTRLEPAHPEPPDLEDFARWHELAVAVRDQIIRANLRLVISIAKRYPWPEVDIFELVSDGNFALIRAVDRFDYGRGNKFSTYASLAILNGLRRRNRDQHDRVRLVTDHEATLLSTLDTRADEHDQEKAHNQRQSKVERWLGRLDDRERRILAGRFGIGGAGEMTLSQIGKELGITRERVRQIEVRAREKLRGLVRTEELDLLLA